MNVLLQLCDLHKRHGAKPILNGASATFCEQQKIGIIGRNGAGKSTLCNMITERDEPDQGTVNRSDALRLSYLEQHDTHRPGETALQFLVRVTGKEEWQCGKAAGRFQLQDALLHAKISELSGGYRTRVKLTAMLLPNPNFLILDEPTNYLDLTTLLLLEQFLQSYRGAFLIVSHDREFLKKTCDHTLEVENGNCTLYPGTVEEYLLFKEEQKEQAVRYNKNVEAKKKHLQAFVDRFRSKATKAAQAQSRLKQMTKLHTIEVDHPLQNVTMRIPAVTRRKGMALCCDNLRIGYPDHPVAADINLQISHGQHVAVLGDNGQGKTTFLKTLANHLAGQGGTVRWGHDTRIGTYAQHVFDSLPSSPVGVDSRLRGNDKGTVHDYLASQAAEGVTSQEILNLAGGFLFQGDEIDKTIAVLSGGERARLCLAGLLLTKSNVLLLDEPTNHLDFETVEALGRALRSFDGTIFFVSHDRTFVQLLATQIIEVKSGTVTLYPGTYEEYVHRLATTLQQETKQDSRKPSSGADAKDSAAAGLPPKEGKAAARKLRARMRQIEKTIAAYKAEQKAIHEEFLRDARAWSRKRDERARELAALIEQEENHWLRLAEQLES